MNRTHTEERCRHTSALKPYTYYPCAIPDYFTDVPLHWHNEFELNHILEGSSEFICGDERFTAQAGDLVLLPPEMLHAIHMPPGQQQRHDTLVFGAELLGISSGDRCAVELLHPLMDGRCMLRCHITPEHPAYGELRRASESIFACAKADTPRQDLLMRSEMTRLFWLLDAHGDIVRNERSILRSDQMRPVLAYIAAHFREEITISQLAGIVHLSESYFMTRFRQTAGMGALEYICHQRVRFACERLVGSDGTIAAIAFDSGFRNLSHFNRQFLRIVGCTPRAYRRLGRVEKTMDGGE